jgi:hypothetical protein
LFDAGLAALFSIPLLAVSSQLSPKILFLAASCLPWLSLRSAGRLRTVSANLWSVRAGSGAEAFLTAMALAVEPRGSFLLLGAAPLAYLSAAAKDRGQKVSLWNEFHQLADGDALSGSGS